MPKQNSRNVRIGEYEFESTLEAERYIFLLSQAQEGVIDLSDPHPKFIIQMGTVLPITALHTKVRQRSNLIYTADFQYIYNGIVVVEDVKGAYTRTKGSHKAGDPIVSPASKLRMNITQRLHPEYVLVMVTSPTWWWGEVGGYKLL